MRALPLILALFTTVASSAVAQIPTRNMQVLAHVDEYNAAITGAPVTSAYTACWGYLHPDGREYAVIGTFEGTAIYNITNPVAPFRVAFILGPSSAWREMKQYRNWIYIVTEGAGSNMGLQIVRMTDPDHPVVAGIYRNSVFFTAHTVSIDTTRALLYLNGTRSDDGQLRGMQIYSLAQPESPAFLGAWPNTSPPTEPVNYVHDSMPAGNRVYASSIYAGTLRVIDVTDPAQPVQSTSWTYPGAHFTHNSWPDSAGTTLYVTDEQNGQTLRVFDIQDLQQPRLVTGFSSNAQAVVHNAVVQGRELYLANYTEGVRVLDITDPLHPAEFGWADTYPGPSGGFAGVWGVCPMMPSGTVIASDRQSGLWLLRPQRNYGRVRVRVVDQATQLPVAGVQVRATPLGDTLTTGGDGIVQFAPGPGMQQFRAERFGWTPATHNVMVTQGGFTTFTFELDLLPVTTWDGEVTDANSSAPVSDADVVLTGPPLQTRIEARSDDFGSYHFDAVPENDYQVEVRRPGYAPLNVARQIGIAFPGENFSLVPAAHWEWFETATGWTVGAPGDAVYDGAWERVAPLGTEYPANGTGLTGTAGPARMVLAGLPGSPDLTAARSVIGTRRESGRLSACGDGHRASADGAMCGDHARATTASVGVAAAEEPAGHCGCGASCICSVATPEGVPVSPGSDRTPGAGSLCFVTGQATGQLQDPDESDLDGHTTLTSPAYDLSSMSDPRFGYWRWFFSRRNATGQPDPSAWLAVLISNDDGATWTSADTVRGLHNAWRHATVRVRGFVTPTPAVRLRFVADDGQFSVVEAAIDDVTLYEGTTALDAPGDEPTRLRFAAPWPNPGAGDVRFALQVPHTKSLSVEVVDLRGALVRRLHHGPAAGPVTLTWNGRDTHGRPAPAGVYFAVARAGSEVTRARIVRLP